MDEITVSYEAWRREQLVLQAMEDLGVGRQEAEFYVAIELGESDGDEIAVGEPG